MVTLGLDRVSQMAQSCLVGKLAEDMRAGKSQSLTTSPDIYVLCEFKQGLKWCRASGSSSVKWDDHGIYTQGFMVKI